MAKRHARGLLDTSVVVALEEVAVDRLPIESAVSTLTLAELGAGPIAAKTAADRGTRLVRLQVAEATTFPIAFGVNAARAYARIYAAVVEAGRKPRGARAVDLMIAATALAEGLPLYTRNPADFRALDGLVEVVAV